MVGETHLDASMGLYIYIPRHSQEVLTAWVISGLIMLIEFIPYQTTLMSPLSEMVWQKTTTSCCFWINSQHF